MVEVCMALVTREDMMALMVGPMRVLMFIRFSSSAHMVRHLRRVSGSLYNSSREKNTDTWSATHTGFSSQSISLFRI